MSPFLFFRRLRSALVGLRRGGDAGDACHHRRRHGVPASPPKNKLFFWKRSCYPRLPGYHFIMCVGAQYARADAC